MTMRYTKDHEYIRVEGDTGVIGITDYAQQQLGDVVYVELPSVGKTVSKGDEAAVVESVKAASEIYAPVSGEIVAVNNELEGSPGTVNEDAIGLAPTELATTGNDSVFTGRQLVGQGVLDTERGADGSIGHAGA